jgi:hypothetical protein
MRPYVKGGGSKESVRKEVRQERDERHWVGGIAVRWAKEKE